MGFGSDCLTLNSSSRPDCGQQDAATHSVTQQCNRECNTTVQHKSGKQCNTVEQPVDGQVSGPQVFRKSDHLPHPPPLLNSPSAQNQQRVRKVLKLGLTTLASDPGCVVAVWVEMEKGNLSDPLKEYQEKNVGHKFSEHVERHLK